MSVGYGFCGSCNTKIVLSEPLCPYLSQMKLGKEEIFLLVDIANNHTADIFYPIVYVGIRMRFRNSTVLLICL